MTTNTELSDEPLYADSFGYSLAMRVMQSDLYHSLDAQERAECDELIRRGQAISAVSRSEVGEPAPVGEPVAEQRLRAVLDVVNRYLPPDGIAVDLAMSEIVALVDPWPLYASPLPEREIRGPQEGEKAARYRWLTQSPTPWETRVAQLKAWSDAATLQESSEAQGDQQ